MICGAPVRAESLPAGAIRSRRAYGSATLLPGLAHSVVVLHRRKRAGPSQNVDPNLEDAHMDVGLAMTSPYPGTMSPREQFAQQQEIASAARSLGFAYVALGEHFLAEEIRYYQPIPSLAALAEAAGDMRLVVGVVLLPLHNPVHVAEQVATLDAISGGRAVLGLGLGYVDRELQAFGISRSERVERFEEAIPIIRRLWAGERVDHDGAHFVVPDAATAAIPVQRPGPPVWIGAQADVSVRRAARLGDAWYAPPFPSHGELLDLVSVYREARAEAQQPSPLEFPVRREVFVADSYEAAVRLAERGAERRYHTYGDWGLELNGSPIAPPDPDDPAWRASRYVIGTPDHVVEQLGRLRQQTGLTALGIKVQWPDLAHEDAMEQLERFGTEVLPRLHVETATEKDSDLEKPNDANH